MNSDVVLYHDTGKEFVKFTPEQEAQARTLTMIYVTDWLKGNPHCTVSDYHDARRRLRNQAYIDTNDGIKPLTTMSMARLHYNNTVKDFYDIIKDDVIRSYQAGNSIMGISREMDISEDTVRKMIKTWHAQETY